MNTSAFFHAPLYSRAQGSGATVVCLHSSTGSHAQWRGLGKALDGRCQMLAPDLLGHGQSPAWPIGQANTLQVDADAVGAVIRGANGGLVPGGIHLVGHSYGAALALQFALRYPRLVRSLTLYEPVAFGVMRAMSPGDAALEEIEDIAHSITAMVRGGDLEGASRVFVGYWGGAGTWESLGEAQRASLAARIVTVPRHFDALFGATWNAQTLGRLTMPMLLLQGANTRLPARRVAELLGAALPRMQRVQIADADHLGAVTHEPIVTARIVAHLASAVLLPHATQHTNAQFA